MPGLHPNVIDDLVLAQLPKVRKKYFDTQQIVRYVGVREIAMRGETASPTGQNYTEHWRWRRSAAGGPQPNLPFKATAAHYGQYMAAASIGWCLNVDKNFVMDLLVLENNRGGEKIFSYMSGQYSAQREGINNWLEAQVWGIPQNASDVANMHGALTWARRSMNSSGTFVSQPAVAFNGTYQTWGDGTTTGTLAGVDCTSALNERFRNPVATYSGSVDETLLDLVLDMVDAMQWNPLSDLEGDFSIGEQVQFWPNKKALAYKKLVNKGNDDRGRNGVGDFFPIRKTTAAGGNMIAVPYLDNYSWNPILFVDRSMLKLRKASGRWDNTNPKEKFPGSHTSYYIPTDFNGQIWTEIPRHSIGLLHSSF